MKYSEINEKKQRGSAGFPIQIYHVDREHPHYHMPLHWHQDWEFVRVLSGEFVLHLNNSECRAKAGDIIVIGSGTLHRGEATDCVYECIVFDLNMLRKHHNDAASVYLRPLLTGEVGVTQQPLQAGEPLRQAFWQLFDTLRDRPPYYELTVQSLLFTVLAQLYAGGWLTTAGRTSRGTHQTETVISLIEWIDAHYAESIALEQLAEIAGVNEKYLCRLFKEFTGTTPIDYVNRLRIQSACTEMTVKRRSVTEAAFDSGFNDVSYFSRTFRKYMGCSPTDYRRQVSEPAVSNARKAVGE